MDNILLLTFASYGLCHIIMYGTIFNVPRRWITNRYVVFNELLKCSLCVGFWCGLLLTRDFTFALYSSAVCYIINLVTDILANKAYSDD